MAVPILMAVGWISVGGIAVGRPGSGFPVLLDVARRETREGVRRAPVACLGASPTGYQGGISDLIGPKVLREKASASRNGKRR